MDSLQLLAEAIDLARRLGFEIREELIGEGRSGVCRIRGRKYLFLDSQLAPRDRLERVLDAIRSDPAHAQITTRPALTHLLSRPS